jgi:uncharacterized membrane protein
MGSHEARDYWEDVGLMRLMAGLLLPMLAWAIDLQASYALVKWVCATQWYAALWLVPLGSLSLVAFAAWQSWTCWQKVRHDANPTGGRLQDRSYFLALSGLAMSAVIGLLILNSVFPRAWLNACE